MIYLDLFLGFLKVGCFAFGGAYAAIPLIRDIVISYGWLDEEMLTYMIAVSESTPGPIMINLATYVGTSQAGFWGALIATFAVVLPSFFIILLIVIMLPKMIKNKYVKATLTGIKPSMIGIILATGLEMMYENIMLKGTMIIDWSKLVITVFLVCAYYGSKKVFKKGISPIGLILLSALTGIVLVH